MSLLTASLYLLCIAFLFGSALFIYSRNPQSRLNGCYALLALSLLGWVASLFVLASEPSGGTLLVIGRFNFAAVAVVATSCYLFVRELARKPLSATGWLWAETLAVVAVTMLTGLVDKAEFVSAGQHTTQYGPLFFLYLSHVLALMAAALLVALLPRKELTQATRSQLHLVGFGILATLAVALVTNVVLPYAYDDFRYIHVGTLSTVLFLGAVGYDVCVHHLFDIRVVIRATLVTALLVGFALELYQAAVGFLAKLLPLNDAAERGFAATAVIFTINAFTHEPLKALLERLINRLLIRKTHTRTRYRGVRQ